jgi:hypothetical protein
MAACTFGERWLKRWPGAIRNAQWWLPVSSGMEFSCMPRTAKPKAPKQSDMMRTLGVETLSRIDPDEDFSDVDGDPRNDFALENEDTDRHYVWVRNHPDDIGEYKGGVVGYRVEYAESGGVIPKMASEQVAGDSITKRGHVLMSCDLGQWQKKNRHDLAQTRRTNEMMFKRRMRDLDLRRPGALEAEAEMR